MVRLRALDRMEGKVAQAYFNSYMVRLRDMVLMKFPRITTEFQFLHGAIKGMGGRQQRNCFFKFQFLHGAIKG